MEPRIVYVNSPFDNREAVAELAPAGFELVQAMAGTPAYREAMAEASYLVGFVDGLVEEGLYRAAPKLRLIQLLSAGYDRADIEAARRAGVPVANNGGANAVAVAEHAVMLMLAVCRRLPLQHANVGSGRWRGNEPPRVHELRGRTLGIVGLGTIGKKTARLAGAFGMTVHYYDIARLTEDAEDTLGVQFRLLGELLRTSDIVSLHVPLNPTTRHLVGAREIALLKSTAVLVNTSRGPVVDEVALTEALAAGRIAGAGLDVFDQEPPDADNPLFSLENVVLTAHLAGPTVESSTARLRNAFDNVERVERGDPPLWVIPEIEESPADADTA